MLRRPHFLAALLAFSLVPLFAAETFDAPAFRAALQPFLDRHELAGAVALIATKDRVIATEAVGLADIAAHQPMAADALFWIASQSKPMTVTALMMLVDEGKVNVDDPVEKYLPEFKGQKVLTEEDAEHTLLRKPKRAMTVRDILSHTSGLHFSSPMEQPTLDLLRLRDAVRSYALTPLQWEPGSKYQYSNEGINTAGRIIEVVSGMPYEEFMQTRLFAPLGMKDTTFWPTKEQVSRLAKIYRPNADKTGLEETKISQLTYPLSDRARQPMPAGGLFSTAADVTRFCQMILSGGALGDHRYLSEGSVNEMTCKQTPEGIKDAYGLGWFIESDGFGHAGAAATNMSIDLKRGLITVWMVQHTGFPGEGGKSQGVFRQAAKAHFDREGK